MYSTTNKLFYFCKNSRNIFFITFLILIQGCTSSIEVAANLGKKYLIPKEEKKRIQKPIYKIGKKYNLLGYWASKGISKANKDKLPNVNVNARLIIPDGYKNYGYLAYKNFDSLLNWNRSNYFAIAVGTLADAIKEK